MDKLEKELLYLTTYTSLITNDGMKDIDADIMAKIVVKCLSEGGVNLYERLVKETKESDLKYRYPLHTKEADKVIREEMAKVMYNLTNI